MNYLLVCLLAFQIAAPDASRLAEEPDARKRAEMVRELMRRFDPSVIPKLVAVAESDPDPSVRKLLVERLGRNRFPTIIEFLERRAVSDPDVAVSLLALERLRTLKAQEVVALYEKRLDLARKSGSTQDRKALIAEHQRWVTFGRGAVLPAFLQSPPPVLAVLPPTKRRIRVLAFGDFGTEGPAQTRTAAAAVAYHRERPFDFGLTLGDNIVPEGVTGPGDARWKAGWEDRYDPLRIPIFAITGNHDWGYADSPAGEILYSQKSATWRMPGLYYTFTAGPAQFFALATHAMSETQLAWLDRELTSSKARWKIVYGHHPIFSARQPGGSTAFERSLLPILRNRAQLYIAGHEHIFQELQPEDGVHFIVLPTAGQGIRPAVSGPRTIQAGSLYGFGVIDAGATGLHLSFVDTEGKVRYRASLK